MTNANSVIGPAERGSCCWRLHHNAARSSTGWRGRRAKLPRANDRSGLGERILNEHRWMRGNIRAQAGQN
jgi:hypothetical protein